MSIPNLVRGVLFSSLLFLSSYLGVVFMPGWFLPLALVRPDWYRKITDFCLGWWMWFASALLERLHGIKIVITGDEIRSGERNMFIMNHRTRLDWMYFWSVLVRQSGPQTEKIILKYPLKQIPGAGWAMQCGAFIFLKRKWEEDKAVLMQMMDYFAAMNHQTQILLFPEGTDLTPSSKIRSNDFARKNNLEPLEYLLHPRTTGFTFLVEYMKNKNMLDTIYDVTVGYPKQCPVGELDVLTGNMPDEVHFHIERINISTLPASEDALQDWCRERWRLKEQKLKKFYEDRRFPEDPLYSPGGQVEQSTRMTLNVAFIYWTVFIAFTIYLLFVSSFAFWMFAAQSVFFLAMTWRGGFEMFIAEKTLQHYKAKSKTS